MNMLIWIVAAKNEESPWQRNLLYKRIFAAADHFFKHMIYILFQQRGRKYFEHNLQII